MAQTNGSAPSRRPGSSTHRFSYMQRGPTLNQVGPRCSAEPSGSSRLGAFGDVARRREGEVGTRFTDLLDQRRFGHVGKRSSGDAAGPLGRMSFDLEPASRIAVVLSLRSPETLCMRLVRFMIFALRSFLFFMVARPRRILP